MSPTFAACEASSRSSTTPRSRPAHTTYDFPAASSIAFEAKASYCPPTEAASGAVWAKAGDDRRTPIGALLRATSLDELPQFWNVFVGHMSLVGPRPERPMFVDQFRGKISHYMLRHRVKAGVTGWAQVNGWRGDTSLDERILCDLYYIRHWSYLFDLKILFLTVWKGFVNKNAY